MVRQALDDGHPVGKFCFISVVTVRGRLSAFEARCENPLELTDLRNNRAHHPDRRPLLGASQAG
jgi:hypothetical protein